MEECTWWSVWPSCLQVLWASQPPWGHQIYATAVVCRRSLDPAWWRWWSTPQPNHCELDRTSVLRSSRQSPSRDCRGNVCIWSIRRPCDVVHGLQRNFVVRTESLIQSVLAEVVNGSEFTFPMVSSTKCWVSQGVPRVSVGFLHSCQRFWTPIQRKRSVSEVFRKGFPGGSRGFRKVSLGFWGFLHVSKSG